jgi:hypothetical protein
MQIGGSSKQHKSRYQTNQAVAMIAMQMRNKDVIDFCKLYFMPAQLYLCSFATIDQKHAVFYFQNLRRWVSD